LRQALRRQPSPEVTWRIERLLATLKKAKPSAYQLRDLRALEALELMATPEAEELLETIAGGAPAAFQTEAARATLERLAQGILRR
jgi:hypothetical protein